MVLLLNLGVKLMPTRIAEAVPTQFFGGNPPFLIKEGPMGRLGRRR